MRGRAFIRAWHYIAAKAGEDHELDVLHVRPRLQVRDELPEGEAKKSATAKVNDLLPLLGVAEASTYQGVGSGYGSKQ